MKSTPSTSERGSAPKPSKSRQSPPWLYRRVGNYQLLAILGEGAMGRVFRAEDLQLGRHVALKVISLTAAGSRSRQTVETVLHEARLAAALDHPNIVHVYEVKQLSDICYIAMELVEGGNLNDLVKSSGPMDYVRACQLTAEAAEALEFAHQSGVIHRDIKPANLMLSRNGRCKLADFGLAMLQSPSTPDRLHRGAVGTPQFVAPEVISDKPATERSDIYSLGGTLWYLLTGAPPFTAATQAQLLKKHLDEPLPDLGDLCPQLPQALVRGVARALAKDPAQRFENAEQFARLLRVHTIAVGGSSMSQLQMAASGVAPAATQPAASKALLWGGAAAILGTCVAAAIVYGLSGGFTSATRFPPPQASAAVEEAAPSPAPSTVPATDLAELAAGVIPASNTKLILELASIAKSPEARDVTIEGTVAANQISKHAKFYRITFTEVKEIDGFNCTYDVELAPALTEKFDAPSPDLALLGKRIRVRGRVTSYKDRPTLKIESADQITLAK